MAFSLVLVGLSVALLILGWLLIAYLSGWPRFVGIVLGVWGVTGLLRAAWGLLRLALTRGR